MSVMTDLASHTLQQQQQINILYSDKSFDFTTDVEQIKGNLIFCSISQRGKLVEVLYTFVLELVLLSVVILLHVFQFCRPNTCEVTL